MKIVMQQFASFPCIYYLNTQHLDIEYRRAHPPPSHTHNNNNNNNRITTIYVFLCFKSWVHSGKYELVLLSILALNTSCIFSTPYEMWYGNNKSECCKKNDCDYYTCHFTNLICCVNKENKEKDTYYMS